MRKLIMLWVAALVLGLSLGEPCEARSRGRARPLPQATATELDVDPISGRCDPAGEPTSTERNVPDDPVPAEESVERGETLGEVWTERCDPAGPDREVAPASHPKSESDDEVSPRKRRRDRRKQEPEEREEIEERPASRGAILVSYANLPVEGTSSRRRTSSAWKNNNPGNIKLRRSGVPWPGTIGYDKKGHAIFGTLEEGIAALQSCLFTNVIRGGYRTPQRMTSIYTETAGDRANYMAVIRQWTGVRANEEFRLLKNGEIDRDALFKLLQAVVTVEQGRGTIPEDLLQAAFRQWTGRQEV